MWKLPPWAMQKRFGHFISLSLSLAAHLKTIFNIYEVIIPFGNITVELQRNWSTYKMAANNKENELSVIIEKLRD